MASFFNFFSKIGFILLVLSVILGFLNLQKPTFYEKNLNSAQVKLTPNESDNRINVLTKDGKLSQIGYSDSPKYFKFSPLYINPSTSYLSILNKLRYKKWEAFGLVHKDFILGAGVFDLSYIGGHFNHYSDLTNHEDKSIIYKQYLNPIRKPVIADDCLTNCQASKFVLPEVYEIDQHKESNLHDQYLKLKLNTTELSIDIDIKISGRTSAGIVTLTPISNDTTLFYYNIKTYLLTAAGSVKINGKNYDAKDILISYDQGRGAWPLRSGWMWLSASGHTKEGKKIGINLGHGFNHPESSRHTEDSFFIDAKLYKLAATKTQVSNTDHHELHFVAEADKKVGVGNTCDFRFIQLKNKENSFFMISKFNFQYGKLVGTCNDENGAKYEFEEVYGFIENKLSIW